MALSIGELVARASVCCRLATHETACKQLATNESPVSAIAGRTDRRLPRAPGRPPRVHRALGNQMRSQFEAKIL
jgi:hypothetical protein